MRTELLAPTSLLERDWTYLVLRGLLAVVFGVVAMIWPLSTVTALAVLWGVWALVDGASTLGQARSAPAPAVRWTLVAMGVLSLVVAFLAIFSPGLTAVALTWVLGLWLTARGVLECVLGLVDQIGSARWVTLLGALVDLFLGTLFLSNPGRGAVGIAVVLGLSALVWGAAVLALGVWSRRRARRNPRATTSLEG
jgi:uncharacterized membrane protein HdeD (DUF308 family)